MLLGFKWFIIPSISSVAFFDISYVTFAQASLLNKQTSQSEPVETSFNSSLSFKLCSLSLFHFNNIIYGVLTYHFEDSTQRPVLASSFEYNLVKGTSNRCTECLTAVSVVSVYSMSHSTCRQGAVDTNTSSADSETHARITGLASERFSWMALWGHVFFTGPPMCARAWVLR